MSQDTLALGKPLSLLSPLSGLIVPITDVPDPVFAERMMGDGIAIDPTGSTLLAPVDATVIQFFKTSHAMTLKTDDGIELLIHVGLETVVLNGEGFKPLVAEGDKVKAGQPLLEFDMDYLARHARSLMTPIILTSPDIALSSFAAGMVEAGKSQLMVIGGSPEVNTAAGGTVIDCSGQPDAQAEVMIPNPAGLHARPSAVLVKECKGFDAEVRLECHLTEGRADSVTEIMKLNTRQGDQLTIRAWGPEAPAVVNALVAAIEAGLGEDVSGFDAATFASTTDLVQLPEEAPLLNFASADPNRLNGVKAAAGMVVGKIVHTGDIEFVYEEQGVSTAVENQHLDNSMIAVRKALSELVSNLQTVDKQEQADIFAAHLELLDDPAITAAAKDFITEGCSAAFAWDKAIANEVAALRSLNNPVLAGRAVDIQDVGNRVLADLCGLMVSADNWPNNAIPVYKDVTPSDLLSLDLDKVVGLCSLEGGASSHAAIIARSLGLPYLAGVDVRIRELKNDAQVILNADSGFVQINPTLADVEHCLTFKEKSEAEYSVALACANEPAITRDGVTIEVAANIGSLADAQKAVELGADGVGLLRTEFLYLERVTAPTEDEQTRIYSDILGAMGPERPVIIRTLDVGGDKPLPYLPLPEEENPFLGERGIRVGINRPDILRTQVRALLRSAGKGNLKVMLPMIGALDEFRVVKKLVDEEAEKLGANVELGIMIEVPSAALMAPELAKEVAFFSIGTNDLTQYTMAMDRGHPRMASRIDGLHPAVLRMIAMTCNGAATADRWVGVCGGLASDLEAIPLLLGLGVQELSVSVPTLPLVKAKVRELNLDNCRRLAQEALTMEDGAQVRELLKKWESEA